MGKKEVSNAAGSLFTLPSLTLELDPGPAKQKTNPATTGKTRRVAL